MFKLSRNEITTKIIDAIYSFGLKLTSIRRDVYHNLDKRESYLKSLPEPRTWLENSYFQYLCQYHEYKSARILLNIVSAPVLLAVCTKVLWDILLKKSKENREYSQIHCVAVFDCEEEIVPPALIKKYGNPQFYPLRGDISFDLHTFEIAYEAWRKYWYEPHYVTKLLLRLGRYSYLISKSNCSVIVASAEYSFASSALTSLCEKKSIKHVNIMHGEKFINNVDAFCGFHEFFVWHEHYISIFKSLRARIGEYTVARPGMLINEVSKASGEIVYDFTYYLGWELDPDDTISIRSSLEPLVEQGKKVNIRMHPRLGNMVRIEAIFEGFIIEHPDAISLIDSLNATRAVIGLSTTVFWYAEAIGRQIIIDDISNKVFYERLHDIKYLWVSKPHARLSKIIISS